MIKGKEKYTWTVILIGLIAILFSIFDVSVDFWNAFFLFGLVMFMFGGALLLLEKKVFNFFFYSFKTFLRISSKVNAYVSEVNGESFSQMSSTPKCTFSNYVLFTGVLIIFVTTLFPYYLF